jgi:hypothetical protein
VARKKRSKVFVSYSRHDELLVKPLAGLLGAAADEAVFLDVSSIKPGDFWKSEIEGAVRNASVFILCWCCQSKRSDFVAYEIKTALEAGGKRLVPVLLCSTPLPPSLADRQWIDLQGRIVHACDGHGEKTNTQDKLDPEYYAGPPLSAARGLPQAARTHASWKWAIAAMAIVTLFVSALLYNLTLHRKLAASPPVTTETGKDRPLPVERPKRLPSPVDVPDSPPVRTGTGRDQPPPIERGPTGGPSPVEGPEGGSSGKGGTSAFVAVVVLIIAAFTALFLLNLAFSLVRRRIQRMRTDKIAAAAESYFRGIGTT